VGTVHAPASRSVAMPRRRGRWLTVWVPSVLGGTAGIGSFLVLGVSSLIGGAGLLVPLLAGAGVGVVVGGGLGLLLRNRTPGPVRLSAAARAEMPAGTRPVLEQIVRSTKQERRRLTHLRRGRPGPAVKPVLNRAESLLLRVDALMGSTSLQSRRASDDDVMMLEGIASRYVPDLVGALEDTVGFLSPSTTDEARERASANLQNIDLQLTSLGEELDRIERDVVGRVTRTLDVHSEFLRSRLPDQHRDPLTDR
jgi:hypothetical protein